MGVDQGIYEDMVQVVRQVVNDTSQDVAPQFLSPEQRDCALSSAFLVNAVVMRLTSRLRGKNVPAELIERVVQKVFKVIDDQADHVMGGA